MALTKHQQKLKQMRRQMRADESIRKDAAQICMNVLSVVPVYVLLEKYGWKRKRITEYIKRYMKIMQDIHEKKISTDALAEEIFHQTGIKYDNGDWLDMRGDKS